jgi:hypothetical protein
VGGEEQGGRWMCVLLTQEQVCRVQAAGHSKRGSTARPRTSAVRVGGEEGCWWGGSQAGTGQAGGLGCVCWGLLRARGPAGGEAAGLRRAAQAPYCTTQRMLT